MRIFWVTAVFAAALIAGGCSLPPEIPVKKADLYKTNLYNYFTITDSPESVIAALNKEGEVVLLGQYKERPVYIKIMAMSTGELQIVVIDR